MKLYPPLVADRGKQGGGYNLRNSVDLTLDSCISLSFGSWKKFPVPGSGYPSRSVHFRGVCSGSVSLALEYPIEIGG